MIFLLFFFLAAISTSAFRLIRRRLWKELIVLACLASAVAALDLFLACGGNLPYVGTGMNNFFEKMFPFLFKL